ncbi:MAG TPA: flavodoxin family protein [Bacillota bacterium]|nr:flavodoxin family protein [Bacillota bacterium]HPZ21910.1 flavodoxin family protein [Bacillota bacterium]HQD19648.1 flavodoxin family protein [Bacillota bacterium]
MKIGIIVFSHTGNTLSVAEKLQAKLTAASHSVQLEQVTAAEESPRAEKAGLRNAPDTSSYDMLIFATPVWAFSLPPVMKLYLDQIPTLKGKAVGCFVTQTFPFPWMGGNRTIRQMVSACEALGGNVFHTAVINWTRGRETSIAQLIEDFSKAGK